jgi:hypothetical protein
MSRTYRRSSITDEQSKERYVEDRAQRDHIRYDREYYFSDENRRLYDAHLEKYKNRPVYTWKDRQYSWSNIREPYLYEYQSYRMVRVEVDLDVEREYYAKKYDVYKRDGKYNETSRNSQFKAHAANSVRVENRRLARKIIKGDDGWDQKPYPDTYLGKKLIWDYW